MWDCVKGTGGGEADDGVGGMVRRDGELYVPA
jgi:hypothetical protein